MHERAWRSLRVALAVLALVACGVAFAPAREADNLSWPHEESDFKPDPAIRFGVLPNGMRYAIMRNKEPENTASVRLRIGAGSLQEEGDQQGLAHFLEHMAFNGSKHFAEGEAIKALQRKGLAFGPHTNAYTSFDETVYQLELPAVDESTVGTGLRFMRDIADGLTLDPAAIERERGVVASEERQGDTPERRALESHWRKTYAGHKLAERMPIGKLDVIRTAPRERLLAFYERYYRPERALLVVVGAVDVGAMEARIRTMFAGWRRGAPGDEAYGQVNETPLRAGHYVEANLPDEASAYWITPPDDKADTQAVRRERDIRQLAFAVVNRRLGRVARQANAPFVSASVGRSVIRDVATVSSLAVDARPGQWPAAFAGAEQELRRALQFGVRQSEVDREIKVVMARVENAAARADTRYNAGLADEIVDDFRDRRVTTHPREDLASYVRNVEGLRAAAVDAALREAFKGQPSLLFASSAQPVVGGDIGVRRAFLQAQAQAVAAADDVETRAFPYTSFGTPGSVVSRTEAKDLGVTMLTFANGVRLNVKQTPFQKDTIKVKARFGGGYLSLPQDKVGLYWALPFGFIEGGLAKLTTEQLEESLAGRLVEADLSLDEDAFELAGDTNARDLALELQLLAAYASDPAYRGEGLERLKAAAETYIKQYSSSPDRVLSREMSSLARSGDARWVFPSIEQLRAVAMADVKRALAPALAEAPLEITIVGDVDVEAAVAAVAGSFGALAKRRPSLDLARDVKFPAAARQVSFMHEGRGDQALAVAAWAAPDFPSNPRLARTVSLLREIIKVRLNDEFREKQGATYSPFVSAWASWSIPGFGYLAAGSETPPGKVEDFYATLDKIVADLRSGAFDADLIERARKPIIEGAENERRTNRYWSNALENAQTQPWSLDAVRSFMKDMGSISKHELVRAANTVLVPGRRLEIRITPNGVSQVRTPAAADR